MRYSLLAVGITTVSVAAAPTFGGGATFQLLAGSNLAHDVLKDEFDRTFVLGGSIFGIGNTWIYESTNWNDPMFVGLGQGQSFTMVDFEMIVSGSFPNADEREEAASWTDASSWVGLGQLPTGLACPSISNGYGITADGATLCGLAWDGCSGRAFKWTEADGMVAMDVAGSGGNRASHISADGSTMVGFGQSFNRACAAWNVADGSIRYFDPDVLGEFWSTTPDGSMIVGSANGPASYYTDCEGMVQIGTLGFDTSAQAYDVSADGSVIVGASGTVLSGNTAFVWTPQCGMESLQDRLIAEGANIPPGVFLDFATGVTADGRTIVGRALNPAIKGGPPFSAFVATLPAREPCPGDFNCDGSVGFGDLTDLLAAWGPCTCTGPIACPEDLNGDDAVGFADLTDLLAAWGPC